MREQRRELIIPSAACGNQKEDVCVQQPKQSPSAGILLLSGAFVPLAMKYLVFRDALRQTEAHFKSLSLKFKVICECILL